MNRGPKPTCTCGSCEKCKQRVRWMNHYRRNRHLYSAIGMRDYLKREAELRCGRKLH
jgi:hypothetical protein